MKYEDKAKSKGEKQYKNERGIELTEKSKKRAKNLKMNKAEKVVNVLTGGLVRKIKVRKDKIIKSKK